ncbi:MAG: ABC transporter ATP-binding protein [Verrucomicrobia bacterium]|nr:MAG: ABC transporter ATP-binding protein [Verrucomicrobiota bacterium]
MSNPSQAKVFFPRLVQAAWTPYMQMAPFLKPYWRRFFLAFVCGGGYAALNGCLPLIIKYVGERVFKGNATQAELLEAAAHNQGLRLTTSIILICLSIPLTMIARSILSYLNTYCMTWASLRVLSDMRQRLFRHLMCQSLDFYNRVKAGRLISRVMNDVNNAQGALITIASDVIKAPLSVIVGIFVLIRIDWKFSFTTLVLLPICMIPVLIFGRKVRQAGRAEDHEAGTMSVILQESFTGIRMIKGFGREEYQSQLFKKSSEAQFRNSLKVRKSVEIVQPLIESVSAVGVSFALLYVYYEQMSAVKFLALLAGLFLLYEPVKRISRIPLQLQKCITSATNVFELLKLAPSIQDKPHAQELINPQGHIEFRNVSFSYTPEKKALSDISLSILPGYQYALVGASGAGKSTILSLLLRFYDPQEGHIFFDGKDISSLTQKSLRDHISLVSQDIFLFHDTIYENIRYGRLDATREEIEHAARLAFAHHFILEQPHGYDTIIGDKGCQLSGGQQQRLSIARAILKNAPVLLLDEATSALDSESEHMIQSALERLTQGRTTIAIAHRLATILKSDRIIVMADGQILEEGPHLQLLAKSTVYKKLYELQFLSHAAELVSRDS